jgi:DNA topoisomerase-1
MAKNLVIVESPSKAKTIEGYLGKDYLVTSSFGHVRDLPKDDKAIDIENGFAPTYEVTKDKKDVIKNLKKLVKQSETIYLASDDDREGEAISWHLKEALNLNEDQAKRIVFREITKKAILHAIDRPRQINADLVNAQQARRILDRLVGFEISPVLWKKIKTGLSAGRVQSVAVRLVVEREREIESFKASSAFKVTGEFNGNGSKIFQAELSKKLGASSDVAAFLEKCKTANFTVSKIESKPTKKSPAPPFTTSTLQQEASRKMGYSVSKTMTLAQKLYEAGKISYMRTDSVNLSGDAILGAKNVISKEFGDSYFKERHFKTKTAGAQEAHEAIRPTDFSKSSVPGDSGEQRLYELIWKRAVASQMKEAEIEKTQITIDVSNSPEKFVAQGEVITFEGFLKVYLESNDDEEENGQKGMLPKLENGQNLNYNRIFSRETFSRHAPRYTEASLVKKLEEMGIGRPSTYAPTISTIQKRGYILKESRDGHPRNYQYLELHDGSISEIAKEENTGVEKNKLFPTDIAMIVNDFLVEHFDNIVDYSFTADVEEKFDKIAEGKTDWSSMIKNFYSGFHDHVKESENIDRASISKGRTLGTDPESGLPVSVKLGKYGPYAQLGTPEGEVKPKYASLRNGQLMETISLDQALELFKLPRDLGSFEEETMIVNIGRYGPYVKHKNKFYSLPKEDDPYEVSPERAKEVIELRRSQDANRTIKTFDGNEEVQILNGRFGPYIKVGKKNVKIPKDKQPEALTLEECLDLAEKAPAKKSRGKRKS